MDPKKYARNAPAAKVLTQPRTVATKASATKASIQPSSKPTRSVKVVSSESEDESVGDESDIEESVGDSYDTDDTDTDDTDTESSEEVKKAPKKKITTKKVVPPRKRKEQIKVADVVRPIATKQRAVVRDEEDSESDDMSTVGVLTDSNFSAHIGRPNFTDMSVIEYRMPNAENTLSFIKCPHSSCNRVIAGMSERFQEEIDNAQRKIQKQEGRNMTVDEYNTFVSTTYDKYGNIFAKGGLDRSVTIYSPTLVQEALKYKKQFAIEKGRQMTLDEYNTYMESKVSYKDEHAEYFKYISTTKREFMKHFGRIMIVNDLEDYSGDSETDLGKITRKLVASYRDDMSHEEYNDLVDMYINQSSNLISKMQADFYKAYGREMIKHEVFNPNSGVLGRVVSTNSRVLEKECCRINIMQRMIIPQGRDFNDRRIEESLLVNKKGERRGNVVVERLDTPIPYNPFTFGAELAKIQPDIPAQPLSRAHVVKRAPIDDVVSIFNDFPLMPGTDDFEFEEDVYDPYGIKTHEIATHKVYTGVKGMETYSIAGRKIVAR